MRFPADYRSFLLRVNGERPDPGCLRFEFVGETEVFRVHFFFGVDDPETSSDLKWNAEITRETRTPEILPMLAVETNEARDELIIADPGEGSWLNESDSPTTTIGSRATGASRAKRFLTVRWGDDVVGSTKRKGCGTLLTHECGLPGILPQRSS